MERPQAFGASNQRSLYHGPEESIEVTNKSKLPWEGSASTSHMVEEVHSVPTLRLAQPPVLCLMQAGQEGGLVSPAVKSTCLAISHRWLCEVRSHSPDSNQGWTKVSFQDETIIDLEVGKGTLGKMLPAAPAG